MPLPPHLKLASRALPDRPYSVLSSPTEQSRKPESRFSNTTSLGYKTPSKNSGYNHLRQTPSSTQNHNNNNTSSSSRLARQQQLSDDDDSLLEEELISDDVFGLNENERRERDRDRDLNYGGRGRNMNSHRRSGSMGSVSSVKYIVNNTYQNPQALRSIQGGSVSHTRNVGVSNLSRRRSSSTPPVRGLQTPSPQPSSSSNKTHLSPSQSNLLPPRNISSLSNAVTGVSPSTLRIIPPQKVRPLSPIAIAFNDSPPTPDIINPKFHPSPPPATTPFQCHLIEPPPSYSIKNNIPHSAFLVNLNIGGTRFMTTVGTVLKTDGRGGKLGEYIESVLEDSKKEIKKKKSGLKELVITRGRKDSLESAYPATPYGKDRQSTNTQDLQDALVPLSPFSYDRYAEDDDDNDAAITLDMDPSNLPDSPTVVGPFPSSQMPPFLPLAFLSKPFAAPPSALSKPILPAPSTKHSKTSKVLRDSEELEDWTHGNSNHFSTYNGGDVNNPFERALGPFFEVMKGQHKTIGLGKEVRDGSISVVERESSLGIPVDVEDRMEEEEEARTRAIEGILRTKDLRKSTTTRHLSTFPPTTSNLPPSPPLPPFEIFLDRAPDSYSAILSFLRDSSLPSELTLPYLPTSPPTIDPATLSLFALHPPAALALLAALRTLSNEASFLGMNILVKVCEEERGKVVEMVRILEGKADDRVVMGIEGEVERKRKEEVEVKTAKAREKVGWI